MIKLTLNTDLSHFPASNLERLLEEQRSNPWVSFVDENELILKYGFVNKRVGLFSRRRMLLLTATPRLIYIDPSTNIKKGEIPFDETIQCEPKNFKVFLVHTVSHIILSKKRHSIH